MLENFTTAYSNHSHSHHHHSHQQSFLLFQPFAAIQCCVAGPVSLVSASAVLISPCFPKGWTGIKALTINDSLSLRLEKLVDSKKEACNQNDTPSTPPSPIYSTHHHYFHTPYITNAIKNRHHTPLSAIFHKFCMYA